MQESPFIMTAQLSKAVQRRDLLRTIMIGAVVGTGAATVGPEVAPAGTNNTGDKRRARYQRTSAEVREFYRVNRYPTR
jgi:hypothetical protein